jgi:uncharacterized protein (TIGR00255 family)
VIYASSPAGLAWEGEWLMIRSMTAFTRQERADIWGHMSWELRSVNHRFLDITVRMPEDFRILEAEVRARTGRVLRRGKIDCNLRYEASSQAEKGFSVDTRLARELVAAVQSIASLMPNPAPVSGAEILAYPGVLQISPPDLGAVRDAALELLESALNDLTQARQREGQRLVEGLRTRCDALERHVEQVRARMPQIILRQRDRLANRLSELAAELDEGRVEQEIAIFAQKVDVDEEMERLRAHVAEIRRLLDADEPLGRRLDFLLQEMNREANTLGAKSADLPTTRASLEMKVLIEQMREQAQNVE